MRHGSRTPHLASISLMVAAAFESASAVAADARWPPQRAVPRRPRRATGRSGTARARRTAIEGGEVVVDAEGAVDGGEVGLGVVGERRGAKIAAIGANDAAGFVPTTAGAAEPLFSANEASARCSVLLAHSIASTASSRGGGAHRFTHCAAQGRRPTKLRQLRRTPQPPRRRPRRVGAAPARPPRAAAAPRSPLARRHDRERHLRGPAAAAALPRRPRRHSGALSGRRRLLLAPRAPLTPGDRHALYSPSAAAEPPPPPVESSDRPGAAARRERRLR